MFVVPSQTVALIHNACNPVIYIYYQGNNAKYFRLNKSFVTHCSRLVQDNCVLPRRDGSLPTMNLWYIFAWRLSWYLRLLSALTLFGWKSKQNNVFVFRTYFKRLVGYKIIWPSSRIEPERVSYWPGECNTYYTNHIFFNL